MIDTDELHVDAEDIVWAFLDTLDLEGVDDPEQIGGFPNGNPTGLYIAVETLDGGQDMFESRPVVTIDVFAPSRKQAKSVAATISLAFLRYPQSVEVGDVVVTIDEVICTSLPAKRPWDDEEVRRQSATYQLTVRR